VSPVRFGLVGYGFGGRYFHAPLIASAAECELTAVVTSSPERQALVGREHPGVATVSTLHELGGLGVEAVAVSTPAATHSALTEQALHLGLAVVCDKPFALDAVAARATADLADERGLALSAYQNRRWDSDFLTVRRLVDDGSLGAVTTFESRFERYAPQNGPGASGGGTLLDFGSHLVDQALVLLGPVTRVYAEWRIRDSGLDDDVAIALSHIGGARSHLSGGWRQFAPGPRFRVTGTDATYIIDHGDTQEDALVAGESPASLGNVWGLESPGSHGQLHSATGSVEIVTERGAWDGFYPAFAGAVRGTGAPPVAARDAVATARVLDAARHSATTGEIVALRS
jgi:predicted dehydrogenase